MKQVQPVVWVDAEHLETAVRHGMELWWDGSTPTKRLDQRGGDDGFSRFVNARVEGKLAEVAFAQFLEEQFGIEADVDWRIYGEYDVTDYSDVRCLYDDAGNEVQPGCAFDIKKTKSWNSWLAVRTGMYDRHDDDAPYILCTLNLQDDIDLREYEDWTEYPGYDYAYCKRMSEFEDEYFPLKVTIVGAVYKGEFTETFEQGDSLYDPNNPSREFNGRLRMANTAIPVNDIPCSPARWNRVVREIVGDNDISWTPMEE